MAFRSCCIVESTRLKWFTILRLTWQCRKTNLYTLAGQSSDAFRRWTDRGFFSQMLGLHYHPWDNSAGACAHKLWLGQLKINAGDTRCLLSHNEEWNASRLESWGALQWTLLQDIRAHISTDIDANLVALGGETECIQRLSAQLCVNSCM